MWTEVATLESSEFALLSVSEAELLKLPYGGVEMYIEREGELNYMGDVVLCCKGETRMFGFLHKGERRKRNGRERWVYCISELRRCVEIPCPELGEGVGLWHFEPSEALIEYPTVLKKDWVKERRLGAWRVRWGKLLLGVVLCLFSMAFGVVIWLLAVVSPLLCGFLCGVLLFACWYRACCKLL